MSWRGTSRAEIEGAGRALESGARSGFGVATEPAGSIEGTLLLGTYGLYFLLKPFYLFPSGLPQIADLLVVLLAGVVAIRGVVRLEPRSAQLALRATLFVAWVVTVNSAWALARADAQFLKVSAFYVFNFVILLLSLELCAKERQRFFRVAAWSIVASVGLQVALSLVHADPVGRRQVLFFNNPNQLGYWALLSGSIFFLCRTQVRISPVIEGLFSLGILYLAALSLSKAAIVSMVPLLGLAFSDKPRRVLGLIALGTALVLILNQTPLLERVQQRVENIGEQSDDSFVSRGYDRIWRYPQYVVVGSGEGAFDRFDWERSELHSSVGTVLFSYGVVGLAFFASVVWGIYRASGFYAVCFLVPAFAFGLAHQGLRASPLWILFAVAACVRFGSIHKRT
jgi:hypothetical protein